MIFQEKTMKSDKVYEGKVINLRVDTVELPDKKYSKREVIEHPGSVAIVSLREDNKIVLVKQYRKPVERFLLELPAGKMEINEEPRETALRELEEETGYKAGKLEYLIEIFPTPGISDEKIYLFLARDLEEGKLNLDPGEFIDIEEIEIGQLEKMILRGEIMDAKTIVGINYVKSYMENKGI